MDPRQINNLWINGLLQTFSAMGLDVAALSRGMKGIEGSHLAPGCQLDLVEARTLWHRAAALSPNSLFGVEVGMRLSPRSTGLLFPLLLHCPTLRTGLELLVRYQALISENGNFRLIQSDVTTGVLCEYIPAQSSVMIHPQHALSVITSIIQSFALISHGRTPILLRLPAESDAEAIGQILQCPVESGGDRYLLELGSAGLDDAIVGRDDHLYQLLLGYADGLIRAQKAGQGFLEYIKSHIDSEQLVQTDIDAVARAVGMKKRTLQRHLDEQGTSFRKLKEGLLKEKVLELLVVKQLPVGAIAENLGYADVSTFHRAFKAWFDVTPRQFKSQIGS